MRCIIITILSFLLTGCVSSVTSPNVETGGQAHMALAESKEKSLNYQDAIKEYAAISKTYANTPSQKKPVLKTAQLNIHPNNPKIDYMAALTWLQLYSSLLLTPEEKENALILAVLIRQINMIQKEKGKLTSQIKKQKKDKAAHLKKLTAYEAEQASLEKKIRFLEEKLQKIKEIDVRMHKTRKTSTASHLESE